MVQPTRVQTKPRDFLHLLQNHVDRSEKEFNRSLASTLEPSSNVGKQSCTGLGDRCVETNLSMIGNRRLEEAAWSVRHVHPTELPAPRGLRVRFCWLGFLPVRLENDLFRLETQGIHQFVSRVQGQAEAVVVRAVRRFVRVAVRRPAIRRVVVPTAATVHAVRALKDRVPPMAVPRTPEIANSAPRPPSKKPSRLSVVAASLTR